MDDFRVAGLLESPIKLRVSRRSDDISKKATSFLLLEMSYLNPGSATDFVPVPDKVDVPWYVSLSNSTSATIGQKPSPARSLNVSLYGISAQLSWTAATGADGYAVQSRANTESEFHTHGVTTGTSYLIYGLNSNNNILVSCHELQQVGLFV